MQLADKAIPRRQPVCRHIVWLCNPRVRLVTFEARLKRLSVEECEQAVCGQHNILMFLAGTSADQVWVK